MSKAKKMIFYVLLVISAILVFFPVMYAFAISFMTGGEVLQGKLLPETITFENYVKVFERFPLLQYLFNSMIVSLIVMLIKTFKT